MLTMARCAPAGSCTLNPVMSTLANSLGVTVLGSMISRTAMSNGEVFRPWSTMLTGEFAPRTAEPSRAKSPLLSEKNVLVAVTVTMFGTTE